MFTEFLIEAEQVFPYMFFPIRACFTMIRVISFRFLIGYIRRGMISLPTVLAPIRIAGFKVEPRSEIGSQSNISTRMIARSEERRVGKECRSRWSPYH